MRTDDSKEFWRRVKILGPRKPDESFIDFDNISSATELTETLKKWQYDFESLFKDRGIHTSGNEFSVDNEFLRSAELLKQNGKMSLMSLKTVTPRNLLIH